MGECGANMFDSCPRKPTHALPDSRHNQRICRKRLCLLSRSRRKCTWSTLVDALPALVECEEFHWLLAKLKQWQSASRHRGAESKHPSVKTSRPVEKLQLFRAATVASSFAPLMKFPSWRWMKKRVLGSAASSAPPEDWQDRFGDKAVPLFWQESKPISFFNAILDEYKVTSIFDVTAGSGAMMEASLTRGAVYHGLCLNKDHQQWLQAIADRAACGLITLEGSTLFNEALAAEIKKFFPDVLESLAPKTDHEEAPLEPDSPGE